MKVGIILSLPANHGMHDRHQTDFMTSSLPCEMLRAHYSALMTREK